MLCDAWRLYLAKENNIKPNTTFTKKFQGPNVVLAQKCIFRWHGPHAPLGINYHYRITSNVATGIPLSVHYMLRHLNYITIINSRNSSAMVEISRRNAILTGWVSLRLNSRLKGYILHQYLWTVRYRNGYTTTAMLEAFTQTKLYSRLYSTENFIF